MTVVAEVPMSADGWSMRVQQEGRRAVVRATGQLDAFAVPAMRAALDDASGEPRDVVLDFADVSFCGAAPLGLLAATAAKLAAEGNQLSVRNVRRKQARVFRLCRLDHLLTGSAEG